MEAIPTKWKHAIITPICKPGKDKTLAASYRPISQTNTLCKILESIISNRLNFYLETNNIFNTNQTGFRKGCSTTDQLLLLQNQILKSMRKKGLTIAIFLDFEKAYDMLWKNGLLHKIKKYGINGKMFSFINSFINDRTFQVRLNATLSSIRTQQNGTPQGSVISSTLFLMMINDIKVASPDISLSLYADDSAIYTSGRGTKRMINSLQKSLKLIEEWCEIWGFKLSASKTTCVVFYRRTKYNTYKPKLRINGQEISIKSEVKFLGLNFDYRLTWQIHIEHIIAKCKKRLNLMRNLKGTTWGATMPALLTIYKALIRSVIEYADIVYDSAAKTVTKRLDSIQYQALLICSSAMRGTSLLALQNECGEMPLHLMRERHKLITAAKIKSVENHRLLNVIEIQEQMQPIEMKNLQLISFTTDLSNIP